MSATREAGALELDRVLRWLERNPPSASPAVSEKRATVLGRLRALNTLVAEQEKLVYVLPVTATTQQHLRRVK
jgi:hypothetical protein